ncbi:MAG: hypothetical protein NDJ92_19155, partial [Thermoanaerobaculia bacterium]|nr:hypothetical protein [Thermoanaerobaculia bacterium]
GERDRAQATELVSAVDVPLPKGSGARLTSTEKGVVISAIFLRLAPFARRLASLDATFRHEELALTAPEGASIIAPD